MAICEKEILDIVSILATPTLAGVALIFAALQWFTNSRRLRHELFDRRYPQYIAVKYFLGSIGAHGKMNEDAEAAFFEGTAGIRFTYSDEIAEFVEKQVYRVGIDINLYNELIRDPEEVEKGAAKKRSALVQHTLELSKEVDIRFAKFLRLKH